MNPKDLIISDSHGYPDSCICGGCGHQFDIDPATEEGLKVVTDAARGGRVLVTCCPHCDADYYDELQARAERSMALEAALKKKNLRWPRLKTFLRRRSWFGWRWWQTCPAHTNYRHECTVCRRGYWSKDGSVKL